VIGFGWIGKANVGPLEERVISQQPHRDSHSILQVPAAHVDTENLVGFQVD
jgi:hypothetical protein